MILQARQIHKTYNSVGKEIRVLRGLDLAIEEGRFIAVVGPSGSGKSTLLHVLGGLDEPTSGSVLFEGSDIYGLGDTALSAVRNRSIGFVFQFYHLLPEFSVLENTAMPLLVGQRVSRKKAESDALALLSRLGLGERLGHFPAQLSGGERQRVAIARALINKPKLLLCDEPTGNLDSATGEEIALLLREVHARDRMSVVLVTHNQELAKIADAVYRLKDGILTS